MSHAPMSRSEEPIRLFRSGFLEFFTHIHPAVVLLVWVPAVLLFLARAVGAMPVTGLSPGSIGAGFAVGVLAWSLTEYTLHRFVFHFQPENPPPWVERLVFLFHGVHHAQPWDPTRLVMPPVVSAPLAVVFFALFRLVIGSWLGAPAWVDPVFAGFVAGYVAYDMLHYATHHLPMKRGLLKSLKRYHTLHHYRTPDARFGVSSPLWDWVFRTLPREEPRGA
jgi:sterol desaturase/sphingolipid hydroxylase (fatty acid hydroxylase superfamily)